MNQPSLLSLLLALGMVLLLSAQAAEYEVRTADGQTIQGEYLGLEDGVVKLRTKYGVLQVASKDVVTMNVVPPKPATADEQAAGEPPAAPKEAAAAPPAAPAEKKAKDAKAEPPAEPPALTFPEPKMLDAVGLARAALADSPLEHAVEGTSSKLQVQAL